MEEFEERLVSIHNNFFNRAEIKTKPYCGPQQVSFLRNWGAYWHGLSPLLRAPLGILRLYHLPRWYAPLYLIMEDVCLSANTHELFLSADRGLCHCRWKSTDRPEMNGHCKNTSE